MFWYLFLGIVILSSICSYVLGKRAGHQNALNEMRIQSHKLLAEIQQSKSYIDRLKSSERKHSLQIASLEKKISDKNYILTHLNDLISSSSHDLDVQRQRILDDRLHELECRENALDSQEEKMREKQDLLDSILHADHSDTPYFAKQYADCLYLIDLKAASALEQKVRPAFTAAQKVREISSQKRILQEQCKLFEYQLSLYEGLFPWLSEFKEISSDDLVSIAKVETFTDDGYSSLKKWLSPQEYQSLPDTDKLQLALDRYTNRQKSNWQIGIEYERYIGYCYEKKGYKVRYFGATEGLEDMGRDLIVEKGEKIFVIQCKRWSAEKTIHEKHIFQLYGTTILQSLEHPDCQVAGLFITTTVLSDLAKSCADYLHITVVENFPLRAYPLIKCNISKEGEKIYHLPFDQQYDRIIINTAKGDRYVSTISEAESDGFRHAWRWHGS